MLILLPYLHTNPQSAVTQKGAVNNILISCQFEFDGLQEIDLSFMFISCGYLDEIHILVVPDRGDKGAVIGKDLSPIVQLTA